MRIIEINLKNYRQYQDATFSFDKSKECDLHLIIGQNTLGKTNLLNAIAWCLFFEEPHVGIKYKAQPIVNISTLLDKNDGEQTCVSVEIKVQYDSSMLTFKREGYFVKKEGGAQLLSQCLDVIQTHENGENSWYVNEDAERMVNRFVPHGLQEFFFFDGEQLDTYFMSDKRARIESPIYEISQVGLLNKVVERLGALIIDLKRESGKGHPDLEKLFNDQELARSRKEEIENGIAECESQISLSDSIILKKTEFLKGQEDIYDLEDRKASFSSQLVETKKKVDEVKIEFKDFIREYSTKINLYPALKKTYSIIKTKEESGELPPNIDRNLLLDTLERKKCYVCKNDLNEVNIKSVEQLLENIKISSDVSNTLVKIKGPIEKLLSETEDYPRSRDELLKKVKHSESEELLLENQLSDIETRLANCSNKDEVKIALSERKHNEKLKIENIQKKAILGERLRIVTDELEKATKSYEAALAKSVDQEDLLKNKEFAEHALKFSEEIKTEMMNEMREKIRCRMQELFLKLTWRKNTYKEVVLEDDYSMSLIHIEGYECLGSISAAERALLALSFTLALHDVSGFDAPLVIDTPVARISDVNRGKFADVLRGISMNKELILLLTPSEYSIEISDNFDDCNSTKYVLSTDDERTSHLRRM